jgi:hypothetical protein
VGIRGPGPTARPQAPEYWQNRGARGPGAAGALLLTPGAAPAKPLGPWGLLGGVLLARSGSVAQWQGGRRRHCGRQGQWQAAAGALAQHARPSLLMPVPVSPSESPLDLLPLLLRLSDGNSGPAVHKSARVRGLPSCRLTGSAPPRRSASERVRARIPQE